nr:ribonuclease H-like domain-containing protein [Tanacetum cinerariifolium]
MLLLLTQQRLTNLTVDERYDLNVVVRMYTRRIVIQIRVEDLQICVKSYQKKLNLTKPDTYRSHLHDRTAYASHSDPHGIIYLDQSKRKLAMRTDELYKFSDGTLNDVLMALYDIDARLRMDYLPMWKWSQLDRKRARMDLPRDIPLDSVEVLRYGKVSKSEIKGKVQTEIELVLEQTQQVPTGRVIVATGRYVVPTGRVIVATGRYVVSAGSDNKSDDASVYNEATNTQKQPNIQPQIITIVSNNNAKFPYLKKDEYEVWAMKMEYWITNNDMNIWKRESKARTTLLQFIPDDHVADFHYMDDARDIWNAVKARFGEGLHKGYDRMQKIPSQLNQLKAKPDAKDINLKFLKALPSSWSQVALTLKTKGGLEFISFDDLYYKLKTLKVDVKGYNTFSSSQSVGDAGEFSLMGVTSEVDLFSIGGSGTHLIKDCDFFEKQMANKTVGIGVGPLHSRNKVNHQNQFVPQAVLLNTGKVNIPPARPQPVPTGKPKVFAPVPTGRLNWPFPVPTDKGYSPS